MIKQKLGKRPLLTFAATFNETAISGLFTGSAFQIEGASKNCIIPSAMLRRNFPQAKTNTRLKVQFYPWEVDVGRTVWFRHDNSYGDLRYTFSRRGKVISSLMPDALQSFFRSHLGINYCQTIRLKMVATAI